MKKSGFTLVEIMIVVAIIALLAAIAIPNLLRARIQANHSSAQATLKSIANALESYAATNSSYPTTTAPLIGAAPPYLNKNFFSGAHNGYTFTPTLNAYSYQVVASPVGPSDGTITFTISTGGVLTSL